MQESKYHSSMPPNSRGVEDQYSVNIVHDVKSETEIGGIEIVKSQQQHHTDSKMSRSHKTGNPRESTFDKSRLSN